MGLVTQCSIYKRGCVKVTSVVFTNAARPTEMKGKLVLGWSSYTTSLGGGVFLV